MYGNICENLFHQTILVCFVDGRNETETCKYGRIHTEEFYIGCTRHRLCLPVWRRRLSVRCCKNSQRSLCCVLICLMCSARGTTDMDSEMSWWLLQFVIKAVYYRSNTKHSLMWVLSVIRGIWWHSLQWSVMGDPIKLLFILHYIHKNY